MFSAEQPSTTSTGESYETAGDNGHQYGEAYGGNLVAVRGTGLMEGIERARGGVIAELTMKIQRVYRRRTPKQDSCR